MDRAQPAQVSSSPLGEYSRDVDDLGDGEEVEVDLETLSDSQSGLKIMDTTTRNQEHPRLHHKESLGEFKADLKASVMDDNDNVSGMGHDDDNDAAAGLPASLSYLSLNGQRISGLRIVNPKAVLHEFSTDVLGDLLFGRDNLKWRALHKMVTGKRLNGLRVVVVLSSLSINLAGLSGHLPPWICVPCCVLQMMATLVLWLQLNAHLVWQTMKSFDYAYLFANAIILFIAACDVYSWDLRSFGCFMGSIAPVISIFLYDAAPAKLRKGGLPAAIASAIISIAFRTLYQQYPNLVQPNVREITVLGNKTTNVNVMMASLTTVTIWVFKFILAIFKDESRLVFVVAPVQQKNVQ